MTIVSLLTVIFVGHIAMEKKWWLYHSNHIAKRRTAEKIHFFVFYQVPWNCSQHHKEESSQATEVPVSNKNNITQYPQIQTSIRKFSEKRTFNKICKIFVASHSTRLQSTSLWPSHIDAEEVEKRKVWALKSIVSFCTNEVFTLDLSSQYIPHTHTHTLCTLE